MLAAVVLLWRYSKQQEVGGAYQARKMLRDK